MNVLVTESVADRVYRYKDITQEKVVANRVSGFKNPLFSFKVRGLKGGDKLAVTWADNTGDKRQDEITIA
jgi:hypothetical protein